MFIMNIFIGICTPISISGGGLVVTGLTGFATSFIGIGFGCTIGADGRALPNVTDVVFVALPFVPVQAKEKDVFSVILFIVCELDKSFTPLHWLLIGEAEAVQEVKFDEDQFRVADSPGGTCVGFT